MRPVTFPATLTSAKRHADKSVSWTHRSNFEMSTDDFAEIDRLLGSAGYGMFSPNEIQGSDIPEEPAATKEGKTKAQRLRAVHFLIWQRTDQSIPFDAWFDRQFERYMDKLKDQLD